MTNHALTHDGHYYGLMQQDALTAASALPDEAFNVAVTSPPYYWARDYGYTGQMGHEDTPADYVNKLADVFDEVKRTLHPEGVFFLNIADTYYSGNGQPHGSDPRSPSRNFMRQKLRAVDRSGWSIPKKSLIGVPWLVALEMQSRGWTLRSTIIWNRCNAFVEPTARDRPHRQYEYVFLFSKSRFYSFDRSALDGEEDIWNIPIQRGKKTAHNAPFPLDFARRCILAGSPIGGSVLDPFAGSGTTLMAALQEGRNAVGIDLGAKYIAEAVRTLQDNGCRSADWHDLQAAISKEPTGWEIWSGNRRRFRKPGTPVAVVT